MLAGRYHFFNNSAIVHATTPAGTLVENVRVPEHRAYLFGRIDRQLSRAHKVTLLYKFKNNKLDNQGIGGLNLPDRATDVFAHENEAKILETATPSSNLLNQVRFTYRQQRQNTTSISDADAVLVLEGNDPLDGGENVADVGRAIRAGDLHRDELRAGGDPRVRAAR